MRCQISKWRNKKKIKAEEETGNVLNFECWSEIISYLNSDDLVSVSDVCRDAREAAQIHYEREYCKSIDLFGKNKPEPYKKTLIEARNSRRLTFYFKFLRNFGSMLIILNIDASALHENLNNKQ